MSRISSNLAYLNWIVLRKKVQKALPTLPLPEITTLMFFNSDVTHALRGDFNDKTSG
jgi:hypothetical protein